ncbi:hypothetical protein F3Y22_tig00111847pilonHSYRG00030 [Hibiscus syriacus]|uniref:Uncharacterized protein n=1 Tax=Hibiscus syriacus TaxID=106335 RepID=A0A6A2XA11_HIBSY|nr:hypothetical protein F3Y22_tig00111847pilonHSYRG00030 [Hibiscus syriacus]
MVSFGGNFGDFNSTTFTSLGEVDFREVILPESFNAELVDEAGNPVPLYDTYLHHWLVVRFFVRQGLGTRNVSRFNSSDYISGRNSGICNDGALDQFSVSVPRLRGQLRSCNRYEGTEDTMGCTECQCDLYNVMRDEIGQPLSPNYKGGLLCCYYGTRRRRKEGFNGIKRTLYLRYTVKWIDMDSSIMPVKVYILDVQICGRGPEILQGLMQSTIAGYSSTCSFAAIVFFLGINQYLGCRLNTALNRVEPRDRREMYASTTKGLVSTCHSAAM